MLKPSEIIRRNKIRNALLGKKLPVETREKLRIKALGRKHTPETKEKIRQANLGDKSPRWKGGVNPINNSIRKSAEYKLWRESVFIRDDYTCIWCMQKGVKLQADHIKPFSLFPELRFAIDNGRTLCEECHRKTDTWGSKSKEL